MKLEEQLRRKIRLQGKAESTADAYWQWVHAYLRFVKGKGDWVHPRDLSEDDFERWLTHLANDRNVAANTQNQAFSAVLILVILSCKMRNQLTGLASFYCQDSLPSWGDRKGKLCFARSLTRYANPYVSPHHEG